MHYTGSSITGIVLVSLLGFRFALIENSHIWPWLEMDLLIVNRSSVVCLEC